MYNHLQRVLLGKRLTFSTQIIIRHKLRADSLFLVKSLFPDNETLIVSTDTVIEFSKRNLETCSHLSLKIAEAYPKDEGKGFIRIELSQMLKHNINRGENVLLTAPHRSDWGIGAIVLPSTHIDIGEYLVRMDSVFRGNLQLSVGQFVNIQRLSKVKIAEKVVIIPSSNKVKLLVKPDLLKSRLIRHLLTRDQVLIIRGKTRIVSPESSPQRQIQFKIRDISVVIDSTIPRGIVQVNESTEVIVKETA